MGNHRVVVMRCDDMGALIHELILPIRKIQMSIDFLSLAASLSLLHASLPILPSIDASTWCKGGYAVGSVKVMDAIWMYSVTT
jgi:hypothetical protein